MEGDDRSSSNTVLLEDTFVLHDKLELRCQVVLDTNGLAYGAKSEQQTRERMHAADIVGCAIMRDRWPEPSNKFKDMIAPASTNGEESDGSKSVADEFQSPNAYISVYSYPIKKKFLGRGMRRTRVTVIFKIDHYPKHSENMAIAERWKNAIIRLVRGCTDPYESVGTPPANRQLLIFVNPRSGPGRALQIFQQRVVPVLAEADIHYQLIVTDRANHAKDYIRSVDLQPWDGLVIVSGDGLLYEVINGLMEREDWKTAIKIPLGIVPGGSGNGLARAIGYALKEPYVDNMVLTSTLNLVTGRKQAMDLVRVQTATQTIYSFLSVGWGIMADIDIESEKLRAIGGARFTVWAAARVIGLRSYRGRVSFLPVEDYVCESNSQGVSTAAAAAHIPIARSSTFGTQVERSKSVDNTNNFTVKLSQSVPSNDISISDAESALEACSPSKPLDVCWSPTEETNGVNRLAAWDQLSLPALTDPVPSNWTVLEEDFVLVYVAYQTHLGSDIFFAPQARLDDGIMWMVLIRKGVTRKQMVSFLLGLESGEHINCSYADVIPVRAFRIQPLSEDGCLTVDGEQIEYGPLQAEVVPSISSIMVH